VLRVRDETGDRVEATKGRLVERALQEEEWGTGPTLALGGIVPVTFQGAVRKFMKNKFESKAGGSELCCWRQGGRRDWDAHAAQRAAGVADVFDCGARVCVFAAGRGVRGAGGGVSAARLGGGGVLRGRVEERDDGRSGGGCEFEVWERRTEICLLRK
jgi:hypothetical protein